MRGNGNLFQHNVCGRNHVVGQGRRDPRADPVDIDHVSADRCQISNQALTEVRQFVHHNQRLTHTGINLDGR
ncbi:Uncharacterised protein [Mycobacteroides abscessus subsp. abscessus]|nr:Uncharacterised protein [Mycobacteroides abscessus subsp. abscessus]SKW72592.1 Uncharacterised protein [Mycobacteroides abscessus subsp. abscessus]